MYDFIEGMCFVDRATANRLRVTRTSQLIELLTNNDSFVEFAYGDRLFDGTYEHRRLKSQMATAARDAIEYELNARIPTRAL